MLGMTLEKISIACKGTFYGQEEYREKTVEGVVIDSRQMKKGYLFIPIVGERVDGHEFIDAVFSDGAMCTLSEKELPDFENPYILVESTFQALKDIATYYREVSGVKVVGITGSVGKTSTKEAISAVLSQKYNVLKTEGNYNNEIGVPLSILRIRPEHQVAVLEMGIDSFGEMSRLSQIVKPDICVITNIGYCHLENLGDRDGVLRAKVEMFEYFNENGAVILNGDDDKLSTIKKVKGIAPIFFGNNSERDIHTDEIRNFGLNGSNVKLHVGVDGIDIHIPIAGEHMVYNVMAAAAVGTYMGLSLENIKNGIENLKAISGRNSIIHTKCLTIIDDCYNANPVSMKSAIDTLNTATTRKVAILGDMLELGENEIQLHKEVGTYIKSRNIDLLICTGQLTEELAKEVSDSTSVQVIYYSNKQKMIDNMSNHIRVDDTILVKSSNGMKFSEVVECLTKFKFSDLIAHSSIMTDEANIKAEIQKSIREVEASSSEKKVNKVIIDDLDIALAISVIAFGLNMVFIFNALKNGILNVSLGNYFVLLALIATMLTCSLFKIKMFNVIRGVVLVVAFELFLLANMSEITSMLNSIENFDSMLDYVSFIWYITLVSWFVIEGIRCILLRKSRMMSNLSCLVGVSNIVVSIFYSIGFYDYYSNMSMIVEVNNYKLLLTIGEFVLYSCIVLANLIISSKYQEKTELN